MSGTPSMLVRWLTKLHIIPKAAIAQLGAKSAPSAQSVLDAGRLAERTYSLLDSLDSEIVLIARMGQNLSQFGLKYSHLGFAIKDLRRHEWGVVHLLNAQDGSRSGIYHEGLVNFYSDNPYRFEAAVLTLPPKLQSLLKTVVLERAKALHCEYYSLTSHPESLGTQNSNQWVLELLACALAGQTESSRQACQGWLATNNYVPSTLKIGLPTQWAAPLLRDSIHFEDQPAEERRKGSIKTITVDSVIDWLTGPQSPITEADKRLVRYIELAL